MKIKQKIFQWKMKRGDKGKMFFSLITFQSLIDKLTKEDIEKIKREIK